jgi:hypothetical protein
VRRGGTEGGLLMGVWDFRWFEQEIAKWMNLALDGSLSEDDRAVYLTKAEQIIESRDRYAKEWEINAAGRGDYSNG